MVVELFGETAVLYNYANPPESGMGVVSAAGQLLQEKLPWLQAILVKTRKGTDEEKRGELVWGAACTELAEVVVINKIREHGVRYVLELQMSWMKRAGEKFDCGVAKRMILE